MLERRVLLQRTTAGPKIVSADSACVRCPGACLGATASVDLGDEGATVAEVAISSTTLNRLIVRLFALPLLVLIVLVAALDVVTNAYPLLQVLPLQLGILALLGLLMLRCGRVLNASLRRIEQDLKQVTDAPSMRKRENYRQLRWIIDDSVSATTTDPSATSSCGSAAPRKIYSKLEI